MIFTLEFKTKTQTFKDHFKTTGPLFKAAIRQLQYERQYTDENIKPSSVKVNGKKLDASPTFFNDYVNTIKMEQGYKSLPVAEAQETSTNKSIGR